MGCYCSSCLPESDMATELENELDDGYTSFPQEKQQRNRLGSSSLLSSSDVVCLNRIGNGPTGKVFKGSYRGSVVAVKKVPMDVRLDKNLKLESVQQSLESIATKMGSLRHPNIVLFMGACLQDSSFCIVSEFCTRGSLFDVIHFEEQQSSLKSIRGKDRATAIQEYWNNRVRLALGAARGLLYLHSADPPLVHSHLKSTNILVDDSWNAKLADFGTVRVAKAVGGKKSSARAMDGLETDENSRQLHRWTAPELLKSKKDGTKRVRTKLKTSRDIYSLGMILWELTSGEVPFSDETTNEGIFTKVINGERPTIQTSHCCIKWAELITRCWSQDPESRPTASEVVATLEEIHLSRAMIDIPCKILTKRKSSTNGSGSIAGSVY